MITSINEFRKWKINENTVLDYVDIDYKNIDYTDIEFIEGEQISDHTIQLDIIINGRKEELIMLLVRIVNDELYNIHIHIGKPLRDQGLAFKIYKKFIYEFGNIYSAVGKRTNQLEIPKIYKKLEQDNNILKIDSLLDGPIYIFKDNPDLDKIIKKYMSP